ncbi:PP2C family serine/threonine-protein phosphatase [Bradyrhizobium sp. 27S5]|uniref:PP2C family serine/threonine-protein phosphatase n=1 Tax=Bradyrhizobium sp. 27S5 TaxID=3139728 RepID=UPI0030D37EA3
MVSHPRLSILLRLAVGPLQDSSIRWRWAVASKTGTSHLRTGTRKQDAYSASSARPGEVCIVVSDGAGSASHGGEGASLVCRHLSVRMRAWLTGGQRLPGDEQVMSWIDELRDLLAKAGTTHGIARRQFAATLVMLTIKDGQLLALQIGDSALVARRAGIWEAICWPENGEFASSTYFITDDPEVRLRTARLPLEYNAFALFSDGIENLALDHSLIQPHARFFDPMMRPIDASAEAGKLKQLSLALGQYLDSPAVCDRTDDDKTLVLLSGA